MPATPNYALPYPAAADPADVPTDMGKLANAVDALAGIGYWKPGGGGIYSSLFSYVQRAGIGDPALGAMVVGDSAWRFYMDSSGVMRWSAGGGSYDVTLTRLAPGLLATDSTLATARDMVVNRGVANQIWINTDGRIYFGSANDTAVYRSAAGTLRTDGTFSVGGSVTVGQGISAGATVSCTPYFVASSGATQTVLGDVSLWTPGNVHAPGVVFNDVALYRSAAGVLMAYANVSAAGSFAAYLTPTDAQPQILLARNLSGAGMPGIALGVGGATAVDTYLYRKQAGQLKLDGAFFARDSVVVDHGGAGERIYFGSALDTNLYRLAANTLQTDGTFYAKSTIYSQPTGGGVGFAYNPTAPGTAFYSFIQGEANPRFRFTSEGSMSFGPGGATVPDTNLYRRSAAALQTDGAFYVGGVLVGVGAVYSQPAGSGGGFIYNPSAVGGIAFQVSIQGEANPRFYFDSAGKSQWGAGGATAVDTNLYRAAANTLQTDDNFTSGASISAVGLIYANVGAAGQILLNNNAGIYFGNAADTNLYRLSAGALKTDTHLRVGQSIALDAVDNQHGLYFGSALDTFLYRGGPGQLAVNGAFSVGGPTLETLRNMGTKAGVGGGRIRSYGDWGFGIDNTTNGYSIDASSSIHAVSFPASSDERLKTAIAPLKGAVEALKKIRAISFEWDPNHGTQRSYPVGERVIGVTAQSVQDVYPEVVSEWNVTEEGPGMETVLTGETRLAVDYGRLVGPLIAAIGELDERLGALEAAT